MIQYQHTIIINFKSILIIIFEKYILRSILVFYYDIYLFIFDKICANHSLIGWLIDLFSIMIFI